MSQEDPTLIFLRHGLRRARGTQLLWALSATLAALGCMTAARLQWWGNAFDAGLWAMGVALFLLVAWFWRAAGITSRSLARTLDQRWKLRSRLEASVEVEREKSAWAAALKADAAHALSGRAAPGAFLWRSGWLVFFAVSFVLLVQASVLAYAHLRTQSSAAAEPEKKTEAVSVQDLAAGATFEWITPQSEIQASAIDEVPLTAKVKSKTGFRTVSLEVVVNGENAQLQPLDAATQSALAEPGDREINASLYLDQLDLKPYDMVAYRLVGEFRGDTSGRVAKSAPQLVQIRPAQKDIATEGEASEFVTLLFEIKRRQLYLFKETAAMSEKSVSAGQSTAWSKSNELLAADQETLREETGSFRNRVALELRDPFVVVKLTSAEMEMRSAARLIASTENEAALIQQQRALAMLTALEVLIRRSIAGGGSHNPFAEEQKLPTLRKDDPLLVLIESQRQLTERFAAGSLPAAELSASEETQTQIAKETKTLSQSGNYGQAASQELATASTYAAAAAKQLSSNDLAAARLPAAGALQALERALDLSRGITTFLTTKGSGGPETREEARSRRYDPADVPPGYRAAVEKYFERLSREADTAEATGTPRAGSP
jgi:hypothetical protein